jgi:hypothetical protein
MGLTVSFIQLSYAFSKFFSNLLSVATLFLSIFRGFGDDDDRAPEGDRE